MPKRLAIFRDPNPARIAAGEPVPAATPESVTVPVPETEHKFPFPSQTTFKPNAGPISA